MKIALVDERMPKDAKRRLELDGFYTLDVPKSKRLPEPVSAHPDMVLFHHEKTIISSAEYCDEFPYFFEDLTKLIPGITLELTDDVFAESYPHDAIFNALVIKNKIFLKSDSVSPAVISYAKRRGLEICNTKQGYPACTSLALSPIHVITADSGMAKLFTKDGIKTTIIENGDILLPPYKYGFIGGASGLFRDKVYFIGDYRTHRNADLIESALREEKLTPISLSPSPLLDLGRIVFIDDGV